MLVIREASIRAGLIFGGAYTRDFTVFLNLYQSIWANFRTSGLFRILVSIMAGSTQNWTTLVSFSLGKKIKTKVFSLEIKFCFEGGRYCKVLATREVIISFCIRVNLYKVNKSRKIKSLKRSALRESSFKFRLPF